MNTKLYENLEDIFKPMSDEDKKILHKYDPSDEEKVVKKIKTQGAYQNEDGSWSCDGDVDIPRMELTTIPVRFRDVGGDFACSDNQLTSLEGCPKQVGGNFNCGYNQLTSLKGGPKYVGGFFDCYNNQLITLVGVGKVGGKIFCKDNPVDEKKLLATIGR